MAVGEQDNPVTSTVTSTPKTPTADERRGLDVVRRFGTVGALFLAFGALGAGAAPVLNPVPDIPVLRVFARMPTVSLAVAFAGMSMLVIGWLMLGRFARPGGEQPVTRGQLDRTIVLWLLPLLVAPPLFSRDVYSYLAQSEIVHRGMDPYTLGPARALGIGDPLTSGVPNIWRETPAPYGPLFLRLGSWIAGLVGEHVVAGVLVQRALALAGVALIIWALPRLARRSGIEPVTALWLGVANPLVLFHLVAAAHNDALAIGLMLAGLELGMRGLPLRTRGEWPFAVLGASVITLGAMVKFTALWALGFFGVMIARHRHQHRHGRIAPLLRAALLTTAVGAAVTVLVCVGTGLGFGWLGAFFGTAGSVWSYTAPLTELARLGGLLGMVLGLGNHTVSLVSILGTVGYTISGLVTVKFLWDGFRRRCAPMTGLGVSLGVTALLMISLQPWYLLWAVIPLAASAGTARFRRAATLVSAVLALLYPPTGSPFGGRAYVIPQAYAAGIVVVLVALMVVWRRAPMLLKRDARPVT